MNPTKSSARILIPVFVGFFLSASCANRGPASSGDRVCDDASRFFRETLEPYADALDEANKNFELEQWRIETGDAKASTQKLSEYLFLLQAKSYDPKLLEKVQKKIEEVAEITDGSCAWKSKLERAQELLKATILPSMDVVRREKKNQEAQDAIALKNNAFRMVLEKGGAPVSKAEYLHALALANDRTKREKLFRYHHSLRAQKWIEWGFRELLRARNEEAKAAGFSNYYEYRFARSAVPFDSYWSLLSEAKKTMVPKVRKELTAWKKQAKLKSLEAWDLPYLRNDAFSKTLNQALANAPEAMPVDVAKSFYAKLGFPIEAYGFLLDLFPRANKHTSAFSMAVVYPRVDATGKVIATPAPDIRLLANLKKPTTWEDTAAMIHELGHAVHAAEIRQPVGLFRGLGSVETEAASLLFEHLAIDSSFLQAEFAKHTTPSAAKASVKRLLQGYRFELAFVLLRQFFFSEFEHEMYRNPEMDFTERWSKLHSEYFGVPIAPGDADWDVEHFLTSPAYVQNYALAMLVSEQILESLRVRFGEDLLKPSVGEFLKQQWFRSGQEFGYLTLVSRISQKPLSTQAALRLLDGGGRK